MSHTPGPWEIDDDTLDVIALAAGDAPACIACQPAYPAGRQLGEADVKANVRLIAAAPELLAELKYLVAEFEEAVDWVPAYVEMADDAKAAIAKAEGRG